VARRPQAHRGQLPERYFTGTSIRLVFPALGSTLLLWSAAAFPQQPKLHETKVASVHRGAQPPSAEDILNSLKPNPIALSGPTRGIRPVTEAPSARPWMNLAANFPIGSAALTPTARLALDALGEAMTSSDLSGFRFQLEGHADTVGTPEANRALSRRRAEVVAAYLENKFGVDASKLKLVGAGSDYLLVPTPDQTPEPANRDVRIINLGR